MNDLSMARHVAPAASIEAPDTDVATHANDAAHGAPLASAIYTGWVRHRRFVPHANAFRYRIYMLYLDLGELERIFAGRWLWSLGRRNVAEFRRSDYFGDPALSIETAVRNRVECETGNRPGGPVRLLTYLRYFGHVFNPVSFYYCFAEDGIHLEAILAEITNTPWRERHAYVLPVAKAELHAPAFAWRFDKNFHVSPFVPMKRRYAWRFTSPAQSLHVHMDIEDTNGARELDATLVLERRRLTAANLAHVLARHPLMTLKVVAAIHWQALRIWLRGNPVYPHPNLQPELKSK